MLGGILYSHEQLGQGGSKKEIVKGWLIDTVDGEVLMLIADGYIMITPTCKILIIYDA